jgi:hypothetical protein
MIHADGHTTITHRNGTVIFDESKGGWLIDPPAPDTQRPDIIEFVSYGAAQSAVEPAPKRYRWRVSFAWYDLWLGVYYDRARRVVYVCPLPTLLIEYRRRPRAHR